MKVTAFVHGHRNSWHSQDMVEDLHKLQWANVSKYLPLSMSYFEDYGPWFTSYPAAPEMHLANPVMLDAGNGTIGNFEVESQLLTLWKFSEETFQYRDDHSTAYW